MNDVQYAFRGLLRNPAFAMVTILTLALAIGANTAMFSIFNGVLLRPLAYRQPERLYAVQESVPKLAGSEDRLPVSAHHFLQWRAAHEFVRQPVSGGDRGNESHFGGRSGEVDRRPRIGESISATRHHSGTGARIHRRRGPPGTRPGPGAEPCPVDFPVSERPECDRSQDPARRFAIRGDRRPGCGTGDAEDAATGLHAARCSRRTGVEALRSPRQRIVGYGRFQFRMYRSTEARG